MQPVESLPNASVDPILSRSSRVERFQGGIPGAHEHKPEPAPAPSDSLIRDFVAHWGLMARTWGINSSMGELFALLYITGTDWTAEDLRKT